MLYKIIIILLFAASLSAQTELEECQDAFVISRIKLDSVRKSNTILLKRLDNKQQTIEQYQLMVQDLTLANEKAEQQIALFKQREAKTEIPSLFTWSGFFVGLGTLYHFDSTLIKQTITGKLFSNTFIYGSARITVLNKVELIGELVIPLKTETFVQIKAGWRLF